MSRSTPWGSSQHSESHLRGFSTVSTAGHGGMMVAPGAAKKYLSEQARSRALMHNGYYCFEEDCDYLIPLFDAKELRPQLLAGSEFWSSKSDEEIESFLIESLSDNSPDYLIEKGITPAEVPFKKWLIRNEDYKARQAKSPDLIVSCSNEKNSFKVITADGKTHHVTKESYEKVRSDPFKTLLMLLSDMDIVE